MNPVKVSTDAVRDVLARIERKLQEGTGDLPALAEVAVEALRLAKRTDFDPQDVIRLAETDPPMAARLLGLANSPVFQSIGRGGTIKQAVVRLGQQATRDVLYMSVYGASMFEGGRYQAELRDIFHHSVEVARVARQLAHSLGEEAEEYFLAGLLHDVGRARCLRLIAAQPGPPGSDIATAIADQLHAEAGAALVAAWSLPDLVIEACRFHHDPIGFPAATIVAVADALVHFQERPSPRAWEDVLAVIRDTHCPVPQEEWLEAFRVQSASATPKAEKTAQADPPPQVHLNAR